MLLHECLEQAAAAFLVFLDVLLQCLYRHGAYVAYREGSGDWDSRGEPFDVAVELPPEKKRRLQCRVHDVVGFDRNENALETHGPPPIRAGGNGSAKANTMPVFVLVPAASVPLAGLHRRCRRCGARSCKSIERNGGSVRNDFRRSCPSPNCGKAYRSRPSGLGLYPDRVQDTWKPARGGRDSRVRQVILRGHGNGGTTKGRQRAAWSQGRHATPGWTCRSGCLRHSRRDAIPQLGRPKIMAHGQEGPH